ncbi:hypothetical protein [Cohnella boryungensis]|uniref:Uncharacterized protein n=1 Tax=Cohnella boryungensis TaxID=768479 RepID=A0ABV8SIH5_9BACL
MRTDDTWLERQFHYCDKLGMALPRLESDWEELGRERQIAILARWETIRGTIPDRIMRLEAVIRIKQQQLFEEEDFVRSCEINGRIAELASQINDLNIWFRARQELEGDVKSHSG